VKRKTALRCRVYNDTPEDQKRKGDAWSKKHAPHNADVIEDAERNDRLARPFISAALENKVWDAQAGTIAKAPAGQKLTARRGARQLQAEASIHLKDKASFLRLSPGERFALEIVLKYRTLQLAEMSSWSFWTRADLKNMAEQLILEKRHLRRLRRWAKEQSTSKSKG